MAYFFSFEPFYISRGTKAQLMLLVRDKFSFLYADVWFDKKKEKIYYAEQ